MERVEESERGWMMLFLVSRPKLTENKRTDRGSESTVRYEVRAMGVSRFKIQDSR